jgi:hypothetical protein
VAFDRVIASFSSAHLSIGAAYEADRATNSGQKLTDDQLLILLAMGISGSGPTTTCRKVRCMSAVEARPDVRCPQDNGSDALYDCPKEGRIAGFSAEFIVWRSKPLYTASLDVDRLSRSTRFNSKQRLSDASPGSHLDRSIEPH